MRNVVLFAAHCTCSLSGTFGPVVTTLDATQYTFRLNSMAIPVGGLAGTNVVRHKSVGICNTWKNGRVQIQDFESQADLAIMVLSRSLTPTELPSTMPVYIGGDFLDRLLNHTGVDAGFFSRAKQVVGYGGVPLGGPPNKGTVYDLNFEVDCGFLGLGSCSGYFIRNAVGSGTRTDPGDSGGPISFLMNSTTVTEFGVCSKEKLNVFLGSDQDFWSPTWNNGVGNGDFIAPFLEDTDEDGVLDKFDNCSPLTDPKCKYDPKRCANPDQKDVDLDRVGDACDNCAPTKFCGAPKSASECANTDQTDADKDGVGDRCDNCAPAKYCAADVSKCNNPSQIDLDADLVGDTCDNCSPSLCAADYTACSNPDQANADGDIRGDKCDVCKNVRADLVNANSNPEAETSHFSEHLGDPCDPVPVLSARPIVAGGGVGAWSPNKVTAFVGAAGIGTTDPLGGLSSFSGGQAGFRFCTCIDPLTHEVLTPSACASDVCAISDLDFESDVRWSNVTTSANAPGSYTNIVYPATFAAPAVDNRLALNFNSAISCGDTLPHPANFGDDTCRVGPGQVLFWHQADDITAGRIGSYASGSRTTGFFWTHVVFSATASPRDTFSTGHLRDNYTYLTTPMQTIPLGPFPVPGTPSSPPKPGEIPFYRPEWLPPIINPLDDPIPGSIPLVTTPAAIFSTTDGKLLAVRDPGQPIYDVAPDMSPSVRSLISSGSFMFATPVEAPLHGDRSLGLQFVAMPRVWAQSARRPLLVTGGANGLKLANEQSPQPIPQLAKVGLAAAADEGEFVPGDRTDARALFVTTQAGILFVGGRRGTLDTGEIWRYRFDSDEWTRLFTEKQAPPDSASVVRPGNVLALAYDTASLKLVVVDEVPSAPPSSTGSGLDGDDKSIGKGKDGKDDDKGKGKALSLFKTARITVFDEQTGEATVAFHAPRLGVFTRFGLVAHGNGTFVLVSQLLGNKHWVAVAFRVTAKGKIEWTGTGSGEGVILDDPFQSNLGAILPVAVGGAVRFVRLDDQVKSGPCGGPGEM